jgi:hypothetical protein
MQHVVKKYQSECPTREKNHQMSRFAISRNAEVFYLGEDRAVPTAIKHSPKFGE